MGAFCTVTIENERLRSKVDDLTRYLGTGYGELEAQLASREEPYGPDLREVSDGWWCWLCEYGEPAGSEEDVAHAPDCLLNEAERAGGGT